MCKYVETVKKRHGLSNVGEPLRKLLILHGNSYGKFMKFWLIIINFRLTTINEVRRLLTADPKEMQTGQALKKHFLVSIVKKTEL